MLIDDGGDDAGDDDGDDQDRCEGQGRIFLWLHPPCHGWGDEYGDPDAEGGGWRFETSAGDFYFPDLGAEIRDNLRSFCRQLGAPTINTTEHHKR